MLYILTTATPRCELHQECCIQFITELVKFKQITWIINIDVPSILNISEQYLNECISKFEKIKTFKTIINVNKTNPSFSNAGRYLIKKVFSLYKESDFIFWLEDDWALKENIINDFLLKYEDFEKSNFFNYLLLTNCPYPSGQPFIFKGKILPKLYKFYKKIKKIDPEVAIFNTVRELSGLEKNEQYKLCINLPIFFDKGREWRQNMNIAKTNKKVGNTRWVIN